MTAYQSYLNGELVDYEHPAQAIEAAMKDLPQVAVEA
jgi:hypothetical protein